jgi:hypothetical protein
VNDQIRCVYDLMTSDDFHLKNSVVRPRLYPFYYFTQTGQTPDFSVTVLTKPVNQRN